MSGILKRSACALLLLAPLPAAAQDHSFDDPLFRRCIDWMLSGVGGALIDNRCRDDYNIPPPSLFICARKIQSGFASPQDREGCALIYEEQARRMRESHLDR